VTGREASAIKAVGRIDRRADRVPPFGRYRDGRRLVARAMEKRGMTKRAILLIPALALLAAAAQPAAQTNDSAPQDQGRMKSVRDSAGRIVSQPARDVGAAKTTIPPALIAASADPYGMKGLGTCKQIATAFHSMTDVLGPDFKAGETKKENKAGKLAQAGGQTVVNSLIPFRGLVREVTGAAPAQRRLNRALDAGYARRGFLRGLYTARKCRSPVLF
jgi:hypothetical protein